MCVRSGRCDEQPALRQRRTLIAIAGSVMEAECDEHRAVDQRNTLIASRRLSTTGLIASTDVGTSRFKSSSTTVRARLSSRVASPPDEDVVRTRPKKRTAPGALRPEPLRCPGQLNGTNHPPMVDLLALASRSTSHRPSCPKARRAMPRCRPGSRLPGPLPSRRRAAAPGKPGAPNRRREDRCADAPVGVAHPCLGPFHPLRPSGEPAGHPRWLGGIRPCTVSADVDLAEAWVRTVFRCPPPEGDLHQTRLPGPGRRCAVRYGGQIATRITPGQEVFSYAQGSPQRFPVTHRNPGFIHRSCTAIPPTPERPGPSGSRAQRLGSSAVRVARRQPASLSTCRH